MLQELRIQNYAIIDELTIGFDGRLNIITGETGAGKSILMGALSLILGQRADSGVVFNKEKKCFVEGSFHIEGKLGVLQYLEANDLDPHQELVIRREIAASGKSRAFINDIPVNLVQLQELTGMLVDLHQQFDTLSLGEGSFQREVLDALAGTHPGVEQYQAAYKNWQQTQKELDELKGRKQYFQRELDFNQFLFDELEEAAFRPDELEQLDQELKLLSHSETIKAQLMRLVLMLKEGEQPVVQSLRQSLHQLSAYREQHSGIASLVERLQATQVELADIADEAEDLGEKVGLDPARQEQINERLSLGYKLLKKHGVQATNDLLQIKDGLEVKLQEVLNLDDAIARKEQELSVISGKLLDMGKAISKARKQAISPFEKQVNDLLAQVGMPSARIKVAFETGDPGPDGLDTIEFLFDANKSNQFAPIRKVASGGELSRLMLCIKSLVARSMDLPTLIFDEIDTGISGEASKQVGLIMKDLAANRQVICITHQPQIAGKADHHLFVYKKISGEQVRTNIRVLSQEERITAIAQMLSGEKPTAAALENAREMVMN
ncbi:DNA repair protein RecN [Flavihumibacter rivuli]|uniref:DNA repair protein RecN n=1 Tax=Flavihumibacter rivuli TaxID=2838156 RepID=UPI001BDF5D03|nr:DNA repair protein RecN [Flavihumibacter rivuli]ULQ58266.1 DNA repair protein RecN [Flavihumibacter rivuli]